MYVDTVTLLHLHSSPSVSFHVIGVNSGERKSSGVILSVCLVYDNRSSLHHYIATISKVLC